MAGQLTIDTLKASSGVLASQNGMTGIAKAWVNYNGSAQTITGSFNVSSVTYVSAGNYTINFTTAMPNATYVMAGSSGSVGNAPASLGVTSQTTSACGLFSNQHNVGAVDRTFVMASIFSS
jgi:hypothetical protein